MGVFSERRYSFIKVCVFHIVIVWEIDFLHPSVSPILNNILPETANYFFTDQNEFTSQIAPPHPVLIST